MAALPFSYYLTLRDELFRETMAEAEAYKRAKAEAGVEEGTVEVDAEDVMSGKLKGVTD